MRVSGAIIDRDDTLYRGRTLNARVTGLHSFQSIIQTRSAKRSVKQGTDTLDQASTDVVGHAKDFRGRERLYVFSNLYVLSRIHSHIIVNPSTIRTKTTSLSRRPISICLTMKVPTMIRRMLMTACVEIREYFPTTLHLYWMATNIRVGFAVVSGLRFYPSQKTAKYPTRAKIWTTTTSAIPSC